MDYIVNVDGQKLGLWKGIAINMHATTRFGEDILADAGALTLLNTGMLLPLPGDYHGTNITGLMVTQTLFDGRAQVLVGKLNAIDLVTGLFPYTVNSGLEGFWNVNSLVTALPWLRWLNLSQWGGGAWTVKQGLAQTGFIVVGQENTTTTWDIKHSFDDGVGALVFHRFIYDIDDKLGYFFIAAGSAKKYPSLDPIDWTVIPGEGFVDTKEKNPWGVAAYLYQVFWQPDHNDFDRRAQFMIGGSVADNNPSFSNFNIFASLEGFGVFSSRPGDRMGTACGMNSPPSLDRKTGRDALFTSR